MTDWSAHQQVHEQFKEEAALWGISSAQRFELEALIRSNLKKPEKFNEDDWVDLDFRSRVAEVLTESGLGAKAQHYLFCMRKAFILRCKGEGRHEFFSPGYCDLRFCGICARRQFNRLYAKHCGVLEHIKRNPLRGFRLRQITLTSKNKGDLTHDDIVLFHRQVKKTVLRLMKGVKGWGAIAVLRWDSTIGTYMHMC